MLLRPTLLLPILILALVSCSGCGREDPAAQPAAQTPESHPGTDEDVTAPPGNTAPAVLAVAFEPERPITGDNLRAIVDASDADGDALWFEYQWRIGDEVIPDSLPRILLRDRPRDTEIELRVIARDGKASSAPFFSQLRIANAEPSLGRIQLSPKGDLVAGIPIEVFPTGTDPDGDPLEFRYAWSVNGVRRNDKGARFETQRLKRGDRVAVAVSASDGKATSEAITLPELIVANAPPRITSVPDPQFGTSESFYRVEAEDPDGPDALHYALDDAPEGMTIDAYTGEIHWTPAQDQVGQYEVAVVVSDLQGARSRQSIRVTVRDPQAEPAPPAADQ